MGMAHPPIWTGRTAASATAQAGSLAQTVAWVQIACRPMKVALLALCHLPVLQPLIVTDMAPPPILTRRMAASVCVMMIGPELAVESTLVESCMSQVDAMV